jgi:hemoglobin
MPAQRKKLDETLLKRLGGVTVLAAAIDEFYFRLLADDNLTIFFQNIDLSWLKNHQKNFLMSALSGSVDVESAVKHIRRAHSRLFDKGLNEKHFDMVASHLVQTLKDMGVEQNLVNEVAAVVGPLRPAFYAAGKKVSSPPEAAPAAVAQPVAADVKKPKTNGMFGWLRVLLGR